MAAAATLQRREINIIGVIGVAHFLSHFYQLALPPLFLMVKADLGLSFTDLGVVMTTFAVMTAILQTPVGLLVDRIGGRVVLIIGMFVSGAGIVLAGLSDSYWALVLSFAVFGAGNCVFHPADYSIMSAAVHEDRMGRAFSVHALTGSLGFVAAPITMTALAALWDWQVALLVMGGLGVAWTFVLWAAGGILGDDRAAKRAGGKCGDGLSRWKLLSSRPVMLMFIFYVGSAASGSGVVNFAMPAMVEMYGVTMVQANSAVTAFLVMSMLGVLPGGLLADRTSKHDLLLALGFSVAAACYILIAFGTLPFWLVLGAYGLVGGLRGVVNACRDLLVREVSPADALGLVFAFVSTGFVIGQAISPLLYGWIMDLGLTNGVFICAAGFMMMAVSTVFFSKRAAG